MSRFHLCFLRTYSTANKNAAWNETATATMTINRMHNWECTIVLAALCRSTRFSKVIQIVAMLCCSIVHSKHHEMHLITIHAISLFGQHSCSEMDLQT